MEKSAWLLGWIAMAIIAFAQSCVGQDWSLTTADFQIQSVQLRALSAEGFGIVSADADGARTIGLDQFVSIRRPAVTEVPQPAFTLTLVGGDRIVGSPGPVVHEKLTWYNPSLGQLTVPFSRLDSISRGLNLTSLHESTKQDVVTLTNGDTVAGVFADCKDSKVTLQGDSGPSVIRLDSIRHIGFAATGPQGLQLAHGYRLRFSDASVLTVLDAELHADQMSITLPGKDAVKLVVPLNQVLGIEQINGPVGWLSSLAPLEEIQTPYLPGARRWPALFDTSVSGSPLCVDGDTYEHGIGVHAYSRLSFAIAPQWKFFRTQYAIDSPRDEPRRFADVTVRVLLDGQMVHEQIHFHEGVLSPVVMLNLKSAKILTLECDYGGSGDTQAHLDWLQPALLRAAPSSNPTTQNDH